MVKINKIILTLVRIIVKAVKYLKKYVIFARGGGV